MAIVAFDLFVSSPLVFMFWSLDLRRDHLKRFWWSLSEMGFEAVGEVRPSLSTDQQISQMITTLIHDESIALDGQLLTMTLDVILTE